MATKNEVGGFIGDLALFFGVKLNDQQVAGYCDALQKYAVDRLRTASVIIKNEFRWFPKLAEIHETVKARVPLKTFNQIDYTATLHSKWLPKIALEWVGSEDVKNLGRNPSTPSIDVAFVRFCLKRGITEQQIRAAHISWLPAALDKVLEENQ